MEHDIDLEQEYKKETGREASREERDEYGTRYHTVYSSYYVGWLEEIIEERIKMSRLDLTPEQIEALDMDTLEELRELLNKEFCILADVERSIYKRRRVLEVEKDPSLLEDRYYPEYQEPEKPKEKPTVQDIINAITKAGIDPGILKQFI